MGHDNERILEMRQRAAKQHRGGARKWKVFDAYMARSGGLIFIAAIFAAAAAVYNYSQIGIKGTESYRCVKCQVRTCEEE